VDSEGRSFVRPSHFFEILMQAEGLADDGMRQADQVTILSPALDSLPAQKDLEAAVRQLAEQVTALTRAQPARIYLGPVLLEGQAAGEFFNQLLASGLGIARRPWAEQEWATRYFQRGRLLDRLGLRVISPLFDVWDDPTIAAWEGQPLIGHYAVDDQGIPARRVELIQDGILKEILMSRSPTEERAYSNGHGRGTRHDPVTAQVANLFLEPAESVPLAELKQRLRDEASAFGLDHGILVRRIAKTPSDPEELLAPPVLVYMVDVETGEEELVRDARFEAVTLRALRDVIAASTERLVYNTQRRATRSGREMLPVSIVHPAVLLAEMELTETTAEPTKLPILPHPYFAAAERD
jgi:predicted Zn-dependent protease